MVNELETEMETTIANLSPHELENLISDVIDQRIQVWLTQLLDAVSGHQEEEIELNDEFKASLERALLQANDDDVISLKDFRGQLFSE